MKTPKLLPVEQVAQLLNVSGAWLRDEALNGRIPHLAAGRRVLVDRDVVERALLKRARASGAKRSGGAQ